VLGDGKDWDAVFWRALVEASPDLVLVVDVTGTIVFANRVVSVYAERGIVGGKIWEFAVGDAHTRLTEKLAQVIETRKAVVYENQGLRADGSPGWYEVRAIPVVVDGKVDRLIWASSDITERKRLEEQLRQSQKMEAVGLLAGGVAHDFNNLLSVILSYSGMIADRRRSWEDASTDAREIHRAALRAADLTKQLLAFSRQQILAPAVLDVNHVIKGMETLLRRLTGEDVALSLVTSRAVGCVHADAGQLEQVILNLVVNAREAMPRGGNLTIETSEVEVDAMHANEALGRKAGAHVRIAVTDTGTGMDAATREHIFEPFFTTKEKGTGLGLSTVFGIVRQSGGHVGVETEPSRGTTFTILLPRVDSSLALATPQATGLPSSLAGSETILLVEDDEQVRALACAILRKQGYTVLDAQNGGEAFLVCESHEAPIHLLLTDVVMPRMNGRELAKRLASLQPGMRLLYMSGYTSDSVVHREVLDSGVAFLQKPITPESLARKVRELLDARSVAAT
jgi:two-component system cell cycle sensor histidine kinase/response regulator CckA